MPSSLGGKSIVAVRQAGWQLGRQTEYLQLNIRQLQFQSTFRLFEWICGTNGFCTNR